MELTQVNNDTNGNPRLVVHFLNFLKPSESYSINDSYELALKRAKKIGGRKFHNKQYGGGIVFSCSNPETLRNKIETFVNSL